VIGKLKFAKTRFLAIFAKLNLREKGWHAESWKFIPREMDLEADSWMQNFIVLKLAMN